MSSPRRIVLDKYSDFLTPLTVNVTEDTELPIAQEYKSLLSPSTFTFCVDDALKRAVRHLYITDDEVGKNSPPAKIVADWLHMLRWEAQTFWTCKSTLDDEVGTRTYSSEHPRRVGELIAEGVAILLLEERLSISANRFYFYRSNAARPDFLVEPGGGALATAAVTGKGHRLALECRSRDSWASIHKRDRAQLQRKKSVAVKKSKGFRTYYPRPFSSVVAVYLSYGPRLTRLIVGDPENTSASHVGDSELQKIIISHYVGLMGRIGMWESRAFLLAVLDNAPEPELARLRDKALAASRNLPKFTHHQDTYIGRFYSPLVSDWVRENLTRADVLRTLESRSFDFFFLGLSQQVWEMLLDRELDGLMTSEARWLAGEGSQATSDGGLMVEDVGDFEEEDQEIIARAIATEWDLPTRDEPTE
ncbi:hypothetical protein ENSA5_30900 [Enhygromyxa salina]|uniref:Uncharacterized protein n=1 Tax=Enhygromyxa salina TaxID=215803 RepID=A0A2S9XYC5_9BACT|nr:hypothetical protein [Enhygromyxa salina]PRP97857.1 hypothetical protein ENSA5_30900 [Enhygromyxa salina]